MSKKGELYLIGLEAVVRSPYLDEGNVWTIGIGHTSAAGHVDPRALNKTKRHSYKWLIGLFKHDIKKYVDRVNKYIDTDKINQEQFDALVSFDYNTGGIATSTATRHINEGKSNLKIAAALMMWKYAGGKISKGLIARRMKEVKLYTTGNYGKLGLVNEYQTNGAGKLLFSSISKVDITKHV